MGDRRKTISYKGFPGGLCSVNSGKIALPTQLQQAQNLMVVENGVLRRRWPVFQVGSNYYANFIIDLFNGYISCKDKKLYSGATVMHTYTNGGLGQFAYMNRYLHTNGLDAMVSIVGTTATACLGAPLSRFIFKHNDRCFCAAGAVLYETAPGTYPDSAADNFAGGASWTIGDTGQNIVGVGSIGRNLFIFKQKEIYIQYGYTKSERYTVKLTGEYGCLAPDTIKNATLAGVGSCVIFLSDRGKLCAATMDGVVEMGDAVQDILDTIYKGTAVNEKALSTVMYRARGFFHPDGFYLLGFSTVATDDDDAFDQALCVSLDYPYDSQFGKRWPIALWKKTGVTGTSGQTFGAFGFSDIETSYQYKLHIPSTTSDGYTWSEMAETPTTSSIWDVLSPSADRFKVAETYNRYWIDTKIQTRDEDAGIRRSNKQWSECKIRFMQVKPVTGQSFFPFKLTQEVNFNLSTPPTVYQETISNIPLGGLAATIPAAKYLIELSHEIVDDGMTTSIILEEYQSSDVRDIRIHELDILYLKSNVA